MGLKSYYSVAVTTAYKSLNIETLAWFGQHDTYLK